MMLKKAELIGTVFSAGFGPADEVRWIDIIRKTQTDSGLEVVETAIREASPRKYQKIAAGLRFNLALVPLGSIGSDHGFCEFCPIDGSRCIVCS